MIIRSIEAADFHALHRLMEQVHQLHVQARPDVYQGADALPQEHFRFLLSDPDTIALAAVESGQIAGFCVVTLRKPASDPMLVPRRVAYLEELCVDRSFRRRGAGRALFQQARELARQRGAQSLELMVWQFNQTARLFYESLGLTPRSTILEQSL